MPKPKLLEKVESLEQLTDSLEGCVALGQVSGTISLNTAQGRIFSVAAGGSLTVNVSESVPGATILLIISNGGSYAVTWGMKPRWSGGQAPVLSSRDLVSFTCSPDGTWDGILVSADAR